MSEINRRELLGTAAAIAGGLSVSSLVSRKTHAVQSEGMEEAKEDVKGSDILPSFRFAMEAQKGRIYEGGSAKEASVAEFPVSKGLAGVSMRLKPGGLRELHWHANAAEWAYMIRGHARITIIDPDERWEIVDFGPGDVWYFPKGFGHSIQGLGPDECHFILVFDNGYFSEFATFSLTDWIAHTPPEVLSKNLGVSAATFSNFPKKEVYIANGPVPPLLPSDPPAGSEKTTSLTHRYHLKAQVPQTFARGSFRLVSQKEFPISTTITGATMTLDRGALRELHWHPNADEWQYYISGRARMTVFASSGRAETVEFGPGDVGYVPQGYGHYIENVGEEECRVLFAFNSGEYQEISLSGWLASNPRLLLATNFGVSETIISRFPKKDVFIAPENR